MKKIILAVALLAGMTFVACSSDDDKGNNCVDCTVSFDGQSQTYQVCKADNGNATVQGQDSGIGYDDYVESMCD